MSNANRFNDRDPNDNDMSSPVGVEWSVAYSRRSHSIRSICRKNSHRAFLPAKVLQRGSMSLRGMITGETLSWALRRRWMDDLLSSVLRNVRDLERNGPCWSMSSEGQSYDPAIRGYQG